MQPIKFFRVLPGTALAALLPGGCAEKDRPVDSAAEPPEPGCGDKPNGAAYAPYGRSYGPDLRRMAYGGQRIRYFEDRYPVGAGDPDSGAPAGLAVPDEAGTIDVRAIRGLTALPRRFGGSFKPSGTLAGLLIHPPETMAPPPSCPESGGGALQHGAAHTAARS